MAEAQSVSMAAQTRWREALGAAGSDLWLDVPIKSLSKAPRGVLEFQSAMSKLRNHQNSRNPGRQAAGPFCLADATA